MDELEKLNPDPGGTKAWDEFASKVEREFEAKKRKKKNPALAKMKVKMKRKAKQRAMLGERTGAGIPDDARAESR